MTAVVIDIDAARRIWQAGRVRCFACGDEHESVHVAVGATPDASRWLECPRCGRMACACVEVHT